MKMNDIRKYIDIVEAKFDPTVPEVEPAKAAVNKVEALWPSAVWGLANGIVRASPPHPSRPEPEPYWDDLRAYLSKQAFESSGRYRVGFKKISDAIMAEIERGYKSGEYTWVPEPDSVEGYQQ